MRVCEQAANSFIIGWLVSFAHTRHSHKHACTNAYVATFERAKRHFICSNLHSLSMIVCVCVCLSPCILNSFIHTRHGFALFECDTFCSVRAFSHSIALALALTLPFSDWLRSDQIFYYCCIVEMNRSEYTVNSSSSSSSASQPSIIVIYKST